MAGHLRRDPVPRSIGTCVLTDVQSAQAEVVYDRLAGRAQTIGFVEILERTEVGYVR